MGPTRWAGLRNAARILAVSCAAATLGPGAAPPPQDAESFDFLFAPKAGDVASYRLRRVRRAAITDEYDGKVIDTIVQAGDHDVTVEYRVAVTSVAADAIGVDLEFLRSAGEILTTEGSFLWDTAKGTPLPMAWQEGRARKVIALAPAAGAKVGVTLDPKGRIVGTRGVRAALLDERIHVAAPYQVRGSEVPEAALVALVETYLPPRPQGTWTAGSPRQEERVALLDGAEVRFGVSGALTSLSPHEVTIEDTWTYLSSPGAEELSPGDTRTDSGGGRGVHVWSRADGWLVRSEVSLEHRSAIASFKRVVRCDAKATETLARVAPAPKSAPGGKPTQK